MPNNPLSACHGAPIRWTGSQTEILGAWNMANWECSVCGQSPVVLQPTPPVQEAKEEVLCYKCGELKTNVEKCCSCNCHLVFLSKPAPIPQAPTPPPPVKDWEKEFDTRFKSYFNACGLGESSAEMDLKDFIKRIRREVITQMSEKVYRAHVAGKNEGLKELPKWTEEMLVKISDAEKAAVRTALTEIITEIETTGWDDSGKGDWLVDRKTVLKLLDKHLNQ